MWGRERGGQARTTREGWPRVAGQRREPGEDEEQEKNGRNKWRIVVESKPSILDFP